MKINIGIDNKNDEVSVAVVMSLAEYDAALRAVPIDASIGAHGTGIEHSGGASAMALRLAQMVAFLTHPQTKIP